MTVSVNQIYNINCLELMGMIPDSSVRLILTDPPYGINYQNGYAYEKSTRLEGDAGIDYREFARQSYRVLGDNAHAYFFTRFDRYPYHYECLTTAGFRVKNCLIIEKGHIGGIGDLQGSYANNCEWIIFCQKGRRAFNKTRLLRNTGPIGKKPCRDRKPLAEYKMRHNCCWFGPDYPKANYNSAWKMKHGNPQSHAENRGAAGMADPDIQQSGRPCVRRLYGDWLHSAGRPEHRAHLSRQRDQCGLLPNILAKALR